MTGASVNRDAGFSIVTYTGTGADATVGHGLGKIPACIIVKNRDRSVDWIFKHQKNSSGEILYLNLNSNEDGATGSNNGIMGDLNNASTFSLSRTSNSGNYNNVNYSGEKYVAYCWAEIPGYSKFGSYVGNGSSNGTFVYTGFRPAWIVIKNRDAGGYDWVLQDNKRSPFNLCDDKLNPNTNNTEATDYDKLDMLSDGFKLKQNAAGSNANGTTYVYMAFAEQPGGVTPFEISANAR